MRRPLPLGILLLTLSALYLVGPARNSMSAATAGIVLLHLALGVLLLVPVGMALARRWSAHRIALRATQGTDLTRSGIWRLGLLSVSAGICALTGLELALRAAYGASVAHDVVVWQMHLGFGFGGVALFGFWRLWDSRRRTLHPAGASVEAITTPSSAFHLLSLPPVRLMLIGTAVLCAASVAADYRPDPYFRDLTATNPRQVEPALRSIFPAGTRLADGIAPNALQDTPSAAYCGRAGCHVAAYREWL
ncbi:MAG TPA: hypothetical protein VKU00_07615, partial [Chthonomonadaceae bacterium]|nr:hypothetical protein [Chthonomonadaceae bacterium]